MIRILDTFEKLLRRGAYETITIADIAREAQTGAGSIYARFNGKQTILLAVHARVRDRARRYFQALFNPALRTAETRDAAIERVVRGMFAWHERHRNVIKTSLMLNDADIYRGISHSFQPWNGLLARLLCARDPGLSQPQAARAASAILMITTAALQQRIIFGSIAPVGDAMDDSQVIAAIVAAARGQLLA